MANFLLLDHLHCYGSKIDAKSQPESLLKKSIPFFMIGAIDDGTKGTIQSNANDWDAALKNTLDVATGVRDPDKINLIKRIPETNNYLTISAKRDNGHFLLTHYEVIDANDL